MVTGSNIYCNPIKNGAYIKCTVSGYVDYNIPQGTGHTVTISMYFRPGGTELRGISVANYLYADGFTAPLHFSEGSNYAINIGGGAAVLQFGLRSNGVFVAPPGSNFGYIPKELRMGTGMRSGVTRNTPLY